MEKLNQCIDNLVSRRFIIGRVALIYYAFISTAISVNIFPADLGIYGANRKSIQLMNCVFVEQFNIWESWQLGTPTR